MFRVDVDGWQKKTCFLCGMPAAKDGWAFKDEFPVFWVCAAHRDRRIVPWHVVVAGDGMMRAYPLIDGGGALSSSPVERYGSDR